MNILQEKFSDLYTVADRDFHFYQDSYTKQLDKESAELLKDDVKELRKKLRI